MLDRAEYLGRIKRFAGLLRARGLDGALLTAETNIAYFSGFRGHAPWSTFARPNLLAISADGRTALLGSGFVAPEMARTSVVTDIRIYAQAAGLPLDAIGDMLGDLGLRGGRIGMELGYEQRLDLSQRDFDSLGGALGPNRIDDASDLIWKMRMVKSPAEIALLRQSCAIAGEAMRACFDAAKPGVTEGELGRIAATTMVAHGAERPGFVLMTSGPGNYGIMSGKPTDRRLQSGDLLWMDLGAVYRGYWSDFCRTAFLGSRQAQLDRDQDLINDVNAAAIGAVRIGQPVKAVAAAAVQAFRRHGMTVELGQGRIGHGIGLMSTEPPHLALFEETVCEEGLVFTVEPRFMRDHGLFVCEEIIAVTAAGAQLLTDTPRNITYIH
jgi:Xaa-Pro aminopeptidase